MLTSRTKILEKCSQKILDVLFYQDPWRSWSTTSVASYVWLTCRCLSVSHGIRFSNPVGFGKMQSTVSTPSNKLQNIGLSDNKNAHIDLRHDAKIITSVLWKICRMMMLSAAAFKCSVCCWKDFTNASANWLTWHNHGKDTYSLVPQCVSKLVMTISNWKTVLNVIALPHEICRCLRLM